MLYFGDSQYQAISNAIKLAKNLRSAAEEIEKQIAKCEGYQPWVDEFDKLNDLIEAWSHKEE